jgi:hypothetical protein
MDKSNVSIICYTCNSGKGVLSPEEWRAHCRDVAAFI